MENSNILSKLKALLTKNSFNEYVQMVASIQNNKMDTRNLFITLLAKRLLPNIFFDFYEGPSLLSEKDKHILSYYNDVDVNHADDIIEDDIIITEELTNFVMDISRLSHKYTLTSKTLSTYICYTLMTNDNYVSKNIFNNYVNKNTYNKEHYNVYIDKISSTLKNTFNIPHSSLLDKYGTIINNPLSNTKQMCFNRENEVNKLVNILSKKSKCNALLLGNPGVGKTNILYGLGEYIDGCTNENDKLYNKFIISLDLPKMLGGTKYRGDFEERLTNVISELIKFDNIIVFIDEIHTIMSCGNADGALSAANILKPYLTSNSLQLIGATTRHEYNMFMETDKAMVRRFTTIEINEPDRETTIDILKNISNSYTSYHNIDIIDDTIYDKIYDYADKYFRDRFFPDKAIDLLDISCVQANLLRNTNNTLTEEHIKSALSILTHTPTTSISPNSIDLTTETINNISKNIIGQDHAIKDVIRCLKSYNLGLHNSNKPIGSFLFVGPTGVGKTQLCKDLANALFSKESFIRLDMSEYMEKHSVSKLIGSPSGYVGYEDGGLLAELVKHNQFSVILLDEIEKAHKDVLNIFLQVLDDGTFTDNKGNKINFRNTIIIMTSNLGAKEINEHKPSIGFNTITETSKSIYDKAIKEHLSPEFINRIDKIITFNSLSKDIISQLVDKEINNLINTLANNNINITLTECAKTQLINDCYNPNYGARFVQHTITDKLQGIIIDFIMDNPLDTNIIINYNDSDTYVVQQNVLLW